MQCRLYFDAAGSIASISSLRDRGGDRAAEAVQLVLEHDGACDLRIVGGREEDEPCRVDVILAGFGGSRLAGDLDPGDRRGRPGAADGRPPASSGSSTAAVAGFIARRQTFGFVLTTTLPLRRGHLLDQVRLHHLAAVRDGAGNQRHLQRRDEQVLLPEREPAWVDDAPRCRTASAYSGCRARSPRPRSTAARSAASSRSRTASPRRAPAWRRASCRCCRRRR